MFSTLVYSLIDFNYDKTTCKANVVDLIIQDIEHDLQNAVLKAKPLIEKNFTLFETSMTFLHFLSRLRQCDFIGKNLQTDIKTLNELDKCKHELEGEKQNLLQCQEDLKREIINIKSNITQQDTKKSDNTEIEQLKQKLELIEKNRLDNLNSQTAELQKLRQLQNEYQIIHEQNSTLNKENFELKTENAILKSEKDALNLQLLQNQSTYNLQLSQIQSHVDEIRNLNNNLNIENEKYKTFLIKLFEAWRSNKFDIIQDQFELIRPNFESLSTHDNQMTPIISYEEDDDSDKTNKRQKFIKYNEQWEEIPNSKTLEEYKNLLKSKEQENDSLKQKIYDFNEKLSECRELLEEKTKLIHDVNISKQIKTLEHENELLKKQIEIKYKEKDISKYITELEKEKNELSQYIHTLEEKNKFLQNELKYVKKLEEEKNILNDNLQKCQKDLEEYKQNFKKCQKDLEECKTKVNDEYLEKNNQNIKIMEEKIKSLENSKTNLEKELSKCKKLVQTKEQKILEQNKKIKNLEDVNSFENDEKTQNELQELKDENNSLRKINESMQKTYLEISEKNKKEIEKLDAYIYKLQEDKNNEIRNLKSEISSCEKLLEQEKYQQQEIENSYKIQLKKLQDKHMQEKEDLKIQYANLETTLTENFLEEKQKLQQECQNKITETMQTTKRLTSTKRKKLEQDEEQMIFELEQLRQQNRDLQKKNDENLTLLKEEYETKLKDEIEEFQKRVYSSYNQNMNESNEILIKYLEELCTKLEISLDISKTQGLSTVHYILNRIEDYVKNLKLHEETVEDISYKSDLITYLNQYDIKWNKSDSILIIFEKIFTYIEKLQFAYDDVYDILSSEVKNIPKYPFEKKTESIRKILNDIIQEKIHPRSKFIGLDPSAIVFELNRLIISKYFTLLFDFVKKNQIYIEPYLTMLNDLKRKLTFPDDISSIYRDFVLYTIDLVEVKLKDEDKTVLITKLEKMTETQKINPEIKTFFEQVIIDLQNYKSDDIPMNEEIYEN